MEVRYEYLPINRPLETAPSLPYSTGVVARLELPDADSVVKAPVFAVVAPTVPFILMLAVPVRFVTTPEAGVPRAGVTRVGLVAKTKAPEPVSSVTAAARLADDGVPRNVATFVPKPLTPVEIGKLVALVSVADEGVPRAGVTRVGLVSVLFVSVSVVALPTRVSVAAGKVKTVVPATAVACNVVVPDVEPANFVVPASVIVLPVPTFKPTLVPVPAAANNASTWSRSVLIFVPHVSVDAPTSGLVSERFVVVVSAIF